MTTSTDLGTQGAGPDPHHVGPRLSPLGIVRSEWIKIRTVRSTAWCAALVVILSLAIGLAIALLIDLGPQTPEQAGTTLVATSTAAINVTVLIAAVLGALVITGEYGTGMVRSTFAAVPRRTGAIVAKVVVLGVSGFLLASVAIWLTALIAWPILESRGLDVRIGDAAVWGSLLGGAGYIALIALLAFAFGMILRSTAGALSTVLGLLLVVPIIVALLANLLGVDWLNDLGSLLPPSAGSQMYGGGFAGGPAAPDQLTLGAWGGFGVLVAWVAVFLALGLFLVKRRDV